MIRIYGRRNSSSVQLVMWATAELGLEHERLDFGHGHASTQTPEYLAMNPMGRVPVLEDGDVRLFESAAILRYLGAVYGDEAFWPAIPAKRAALDVWAEWGKGTFTEAVLEVFVHDVRTKPEQQNLAVLAEISSRLTSLASVLDHRLEQGPFLGGKALSFADIACGHILHRYFTLAWDRPNLPNLARYYENLQTRSAYRENAMVSYEALRDSY